MKIKDIEIDFDFLDADNVEKFEKEAIKVIEESQKKEIVELSYSETIRRECKVVENFIDNVFGEGISQKIFKGKTNLTEHIQVFQIIIDEKNRKQQDLQNLLNRYSPNRERRRKGKK